MKKIAILMNTAQMLQIHDVENYKNEFYSKLFDSLMNKMENKVILFDYIYESVKTNMFDLVDLQLQKEEFIRLVNLESLENEFNYSLNEYLSCLNTII